jgi:trehalose 6-phosphate synthase
VMLALPLRDGMCLAAKEYLAARTDNTGHLILSEFSGAADGLAHADLVNPYDIDAVKNAIVTSANSHGRNTSQIAAMRRDLAGYDAADWTDRFLTAVTDGARGIGVNG